LQSPLSKGVILADEVGLGKTIEAGIVLCQFWAERKRRLLVICPASLRKQWALELQEKFNLPTRVLDAKAYRESNGQRRALEREGRDHPVVELRERLARGTEGDRLGSGGHRRSPQAAQRLPAEQQVGQGIRWATEDCRKLLLTATPLQNSLLELYGLSTLIDEHLFGDLNSFRSQYASAGSSVSELRQRLSRLLQAHAAQPGHRVHPLHRAAADHATVQPERRRARALRGGVWLPAARRQLRAALSASGT
jgi:hypothetical protein